MTREAMTTDDDQRSIVGRAFLVARRQPAPLFEPVNAPLHDVATGIDRRIKGQWPTWRRCILGQLIAVAGVEVRVINLNTMTDPVPARIIATPTSVLDGRIISLGNPYPEDLLKLLERPRDEAREEAME
jgi:hypothetical protein